VVIIIIVIGYIILSIIEPFLLFKQEPASYAKQFGGKVMNDDDDIISILKA